MVKIYDNPAANPDVDPPLNYRLIVCYFGIGLVLFHGQSEHALRWGDNAWEPHPLHHDGRPYQINKEDGDTPGRKTLPGKTCAAPAGVRAGNWVNGDAPGRWIGSLAARLQLFSIQSNCKAPWYGEVLLSWPTTLPPIPSKVPLGVAGVDAELVIKEIMGSDIGGEAVDGDLRVRQGMERQEICLLSSQLMHLRRKLSDTRAEIDRQDIVLKLSLIRINTNVTRIAASPACRWVTENNVVEDIV